MPVVASQRRGETRRSISTAAARYPATPTGGETNSVAAQRNDSPVISRPPIRPARSMRSTNHSSSAPAATAIPPSQTRNQTTSIRTLADDPQSKASASSRPDAGAPSSRNTLNNSQNAAKTKPSAIVVVTMSDAGVKMPNQRYTVLAISGDTGMICAVGLWPMR
jgi:hypothetical protein